MTKHTLTRGLSWLAPCVLLGALALGWTGCGPNNILPREMEPSADVFGTVLVVDTSGGTGITGIAGVITATDSEGRVYSAPVNLSTIAAPDAGIAPYIAPSVAGLGGIPYGWYHFNDPFLPTGRYSFSASVAVSPVTSAVTLEGGPAASINIDEASRGALGLLPPYVATVE